MRKSFVNIILTAILVLAVASGCVNDNKEKVTWFKNMDDAIQQNLSVHGASELTRIEAEQEILVLSRGWD